MKKCHYLSFQERYIPLILEGRKTQTRRRFGEDGGLEVGDVVAVRVPWKKQTYGLVEITAVYLQRLDEISELEVEKEGFQKLEDFKRSWGRIYGDTNGREIIVVYEFRVVSGASQP